MNELEQLRERAIAELRTARGPVPTGMLATTLDVPTHRIQLALHVPLQRGELHFSAEGWSIPEADARQPAFDAAQARIDG